MSIELPPLPSKSPDWDAIDAYAEVAAERERILLARVAELESADIHSCHDDCQRLACVQARRIAEMEAVLSETVALYGKPGGPWNIPVDPGGWLERARAAISGSGVK